MFSFVLYFDVETKDFLHAELKLFFQPIPF